MNKFLLTSNQFSRVKKVGIFFLFFWERSGNHILRPSGNFTFFHSFLAVFIGGMSGIFFLKIARHPRWFFETIWRQRMRFENPSWCTSCAASWRMPNYPLPVDFKILAPSKVPGWNWNKSYWFYIIRNFIQLWISRERRRSFMIHESLRSPRLPAQPLSPALSASPSICMKRGSSEKRRKVPGSSWTKDVLKEPK